MGTHKKQSKINHSGSTKAFNELFKFALVLTPPSIFIKDKDNEQRYLYSCFPMTQK